jgi:hypothetical protein
MFSIYDLENKSKRTKITNWKYNLQKVRQELIAEGYLKTGSPRGIWEISKEGAKYYTKLKNEKIKDTLKEYDYNLELMDFRKDIIEYDYNIIWNYLKNVKNFNAMFSKNICYNPVITIIVDEEEMDTVCPPKEIEYKELLDQISTNVKKYNEYKRKSMVFENEYRRECIDKPKVQEKPQIKIDQEKFSSTI